MQSPTHLSLVFDIMLGGSLQFYLKRNGRFEFDQARLYAAEVRSSVGHMSSRLDGLVGWLVGWLAGWLLGWVIG